MTNRSSDPAYTAPVYEDILEQLDQIIELLKDATWEVTSTGDDHTSPGPGWEPFAVFNAGPNRPSVWWRRRL